jgi:hypothetical protein
VARRRILAKPVKASSPTVHGLDAFRGRTAVAGRAKAQHLVVKASTARTMRFRIRPVKHSAALARG